MKVLKPQYMGEITPKNKGNVGSHGKWDDPPSNRPDIHLAGLPARQVPSCAVMRILKTPGVFVAAGILKEWFRKYTWAVTKTLAVCSIEGVILPSYIGIIISHYKDPYQPTSIMECQQGFERCSLECPVGS